MRHSSTDTVPDKAGEAAAAFAGLARPPVVLQVLPALDTGGVEQGTLEIAEAVTVAGGRALVASAGGRLAVRLARWDALHLEMPLDRKGPGAIVANARRIARAIREHGVDIVHARSRAPAWSARLAARRTGARFVTTYHGTYNEDLPFKRRYNAIMASGERVIAISEFIRAHLLERHPVEPERVVVIHRGVDLERYRPEAIGAPRILRLQDQWRLPEDARVVMLPGRLTRWKGQSVLLEAFARLARAARFADVRCVLAGSDQGRSGYAAALAERARRADIGGRVVFAGDCDDMPAAYILSAVVVSASTDPEAFGRVMAEAGAMGTPVIASDHGAAPEIVRVGETGWLVPPGEPEALAAALARVLDLDSAARLALAARARAHVAERFSKDLMCARTLGVYAGLLRDGA